MLLLALRTAAAVEGGIGWEAGHSQVVGVDMGSEDAVDIAACVEGGILEQEERHIVHGAVEVMAAHIYPEGAGIGLAAGVNRSPDAVEEDIVLGEAHIGPVEGHTHTQVGESLL